MKTYDKKTSVFVNLSRLYEDSDFHKDVDSIFEVLETTIDKFYDKLAKLKASKPKPEWD